MNNKKYWLIYFLLHFTVFLCAQKEIITVDIAKASKEFVPLSRVFKDLEYIPLETTKDCLLRHATFYLTDKYIVGLNALGPAYLFDRKTGKFIKEISRHGKGPEEYSFMIVPVYGFDEKNNIQMIDNGKEWKAFDIEKDKYVSVIKKPSVKYQKEGKYQGSIINPWCIGKNKYVGFVNNKTNKENIKLMLFDKEGTVFKEFFTGSTSVNENVYGYSNPGLFYEYNKKLYFKELAYNDTVFHLTEQALVPHIAFNLGDAEVSHEYGVTSEYNKNALLLFFVCETDRYILFSYTYHGSANALKTCGYFDKRTQKTVLCKKDGNESGYVNDIDGLSPFYPRYVNLKGELMGALDPEGLLDYFEVHSKTGLSSRGKLLLSALKEDDNPIIVIAQAKK